jgi:cytochrome c peroxidase
VVAVVAASACGQWTPDPDGFTEQEFALMSSMALPAAPGSAPPGSTAAFGQRLFFDPTLAGPIRVSHEGQRVVLGAVGQAQAVACADCHDPRAAFSDSRSSPNNVSLGVDWTFRNSMTMLNVAQYQSWAWDGRSDSLAMHVAVAYESRRTMAGTHLRLARALWQSPRHRDRFSAVSPLLLNPNLDPASPGAAQFAPPLPDGGVGPVPAAEEPYLRAVAQVAYAAMADYLATLDATGSPFDRFVLEGDREAMDVDQRAGLKLFLGKAGCIECHSGRHFTDNAFHGLGVPQRGEHVPPTDEGRFDGIAALNGSSYKRAAIDPGTDAERGTFRTKSLRNVALTGPWMHAGQFDTLQEVVWHYNNGGDRSVQYPVSRLMHPLELTEDEVRQVVAFLHALTGQQPPAELTCGDPMPDGGSRFPVCP